MINDEGCETTDGLPCGPVAPTGAATVRLRPAGQAGGAISEGFWAQRQRANRETSIPLGPKRLEEAGNFENFRLAAGISHGSYEGQLFNDSDVYKWLEALAWECGRQPSDELAAWQHEITALVASAQDASGYLNTYYQLSGPEQARFSNLTFGHELYCAGHLMQAAVAQRRAGGSDALLDVATRLGDHLAATFGPEGRRGVPGHPEIEMALVEMYRETERPRYLDLARFFVDGRGHRSLPLQRYSSAYFQDETPLRLAETVVGHAVRALYLNAGATDVASEAGDETLLAPLEKQWQSMVGTKLYITGGVGSRWEGESFGDPYELPPDLAYCETCAAIASAQWSWRMLLASGEARYADLIERTLFNAVLPGVSLDGSLFAYVNPLQVRAGSGAVSDRSPATGRKEWFGTACCPANVMRTLASLQHYLLTASPGGLQLHQFTSGELEAAVAGGRVRLGVSTDYPWSGAVEIEVNDAPGSEWELAVRLPAWCDDPSMSVNGAPSSSRLLPGSYARTKRRWKKGDRVVVGLPMPIRRTVAHPKVDAVRGCVALERGPLVYCFEQVDQPAGVDLDSVALLDGSVELQSDAAGVPGITAVKAPALSLAAARSGRPLYQDSHVADDPDRRSVSLCAIPYYAWGNRGGGAMRVWLPAAT